jgi:ABC-type sugar transport system ATPase subunit
MADEIMVLKDGRLVQQGRPQVLYDQPMNQFVGRFLGSFIQTPHITFSNKKDITYADNIHKLVIDPIWSRTFADRSIERSLFFLDLMKYLYKK